MHGMACVGGVGLRMGMSARYARLVDWNSSRSAKLKMSSPSPIGAPQGLGSDRMVFSSTKISLSKERY